MTLIEYGNLTVNLIKMKPEMIIKCTMPEQLLDKVSKIGDQEMKLIVQKNCKVFVDIPSRLFEK